MAACGYGPSRLRKARASLRLRALAPLRSIQIELVRGSTHFRLLLCHFGGTILDTNLVSAMGSTLQFDARRAPHLNGMRSSRVYQANSL